VIAGNHQLKAAQQLGWTEIAVVFVDDDEATAKAYALADNRTADLGTYDVGALADLLSSVSTDVDLLVATGYDESDLEALLHLSNTPDLDDLIDDIGAPTDDDKLERVVLKLPDDLAEAIRSEIKRIGSDAQAVALWLNL
jgi:ParB-like chromosome segregation protein Spo0J